MSVLYPLTLKSGFKTSKTGTASKLVRLLSILFFISFSFQGAMAQDEKEIQKRKEEELKKIEAAQFAEKLNSNPKYKARLAVTDKSKADQTVISEEEQKRLAIQQEAEEASRISAKKRSEIITGSLMPFIQYQVNTRAGYVEYVITNNGAEIFKQQINGTAGLYQRQVQAEKESIYASNILRRNLNYPKDALRAELLSLGTTAPVAASTYRSNNLERTNADYTFNGGGGTVPSSGPATPYPSIITVSGVPTGATVKEVKLIGLNHTWPNDLDILLQSPTGMNVHIMSDCGGGADLVNIDYTFSDAASSNLQDEAFSPSGTYLPTNWEGLADNFPAPGPGNTTTALTLSTFGNGNHNGDWKLFIVDDLGGDQGNLTGWSITFTGGASTSCTPVSITGQPANATVCSGSNTSFTVTAGPVGVSYNWQVNTGSGFTYLTNTGVYSGVNTATLNITGATMAMNGYQYRCVVFCDQGGLPEISNLATLTLQASPSSPAVSPTSVSICIGGSQQIAVGGGAQTTFGGGPGVTIPGTGTSSNPGAPYPSSIIVSGLPLQSIVKSVTINGFAHTWPDDVDIILKSPTGALTILMSDAGGSADATGQNFTFDDAASALLADNALNASGTYRPTNYVTGDNWPAPGPGIVNQATPTLGSFGAGNHNGTWELYVYDDTGGDIGSLAGWSITFEAFGSAVFTPATGLYTDAGLTTPYIAGTPIGIVYAAPATTTIYGVTVNDGTCTSLPTNVTVTVNQPTVITGQPVNMSACVGSTKTLSVTATGSSLTYQWQVDPGTGTFSNITTSANNPSGFIYTGQTSNTLSINTILTSMNGFKYRCVVTGGCLPALNSNEVTLTLNALPVISISKIGDCAPSTLTASGANTYSWAPATGLSATTGATVTANPTANTVYTVTGTNTTTGCSNTAKVDVKFTPSIPTVTPAAPIICVGSLQQLSTGSTSASTASSGPISVAIPDNDGVNGANHALTVSGVTSAVQSISVTFNINHTWDSDLDINLVAPNGNILNLVGARGGSGDNFTNTTISSTSSTSLGSGTAPFTGTFAADGLIGWGPSSFASNVSNFASLFSVPNGTWRLAIADFAGGDVGTLTSWSITINYSAPPNPGIWTPVTGLFSDAAGTIPYVAGTPAVNVYASPAVTTTYSVSVVNKTNPTVSFSGGGSITVPGVAPTSSSSGAAGPYPSTLSVSGLPANAVIKSVSLKGMYHSFPDDLDILLQSPTGVKVVLMSDCGSGTDLVGTNLTFDDAAGASLPDASAISSGTYKPTNFVDPDTYPAPVGSFSQASPALSLFTGDPNGTWNLYVADDASGDVGGITGWEITFTLPDTVTCTTAPKTVTVTVQNPIMFTTQPSNVTTCQNNSVTFTAAASGIVQTIRWEVSTNGGATWTTIASSNSTTLTLANVQPSQNGNRYRCVMSNSVCGSVNSSSATLTVNSLPTVSLSLNPAGQTELRPGLLTTLSVNSAPAATSYAWYVDGVIQPGITTSSYTVDAYNLGTYTVTATDANGCANTTAGVTFTATPTSNLFIYPNPTSGAFFVTYYFPVVMKPITINVIDMKGRKMISRSEVTTAPYTRFDFSASKLASGVYIVEILDGRGKRLDAGRLVVNR